jgi:Flp pilus assembly protein TadD
MSRWMNKRVVLLASVLLAACATRPPLPSVEPLLHDELFAAPSEHISANDVFAASEDMKHFLHVEIAAQLRGVGARQALVNALYNKDQLKLEYDSEMTRNAAEAFAARSGNCLSLVIMTAALAKELGLPLQYQASVAVDDALGRSGDIYFFVGHVNVTLGKGAFARRGTDDLVTIDFLPPEDVIGTRMTTIGEETIVAMYMNNRAAESLALGQVNEAYWWARAAVLEDPRFLSALNTLGIIYRHHGNPAEAEKVLRVALAREPDNTRVMSNLIPVLDDLGRVDEAKALAQTLARLEPNPPFSFYERGLKALSVGDFRAARDLFATEVDRSPYYSEFHFWLGIAYVGLGETDKARNEFSSAVEYSTTRKEHDLYASKLDRIKSIRVQ